MIPIGPLMREHRLIERVVALMESEASKIAVHRQADPVFIETAVDFFRTYADRCHHGKEEDLLFVQLRSKALSPDLEKIMNELVEEHKLGREVVGKLIDANERYKKGSHAALDEIGGYLSQLASFYPVHIRKEDKDFFYPCMEYFTKQELDTMLDQFWDFDRKLVHEKYGRTVDELEGRG